MKCKQCDKEAKSLGLCSTHYSQQHRAKRRPNEPAPEPVYPTECSECSRPVRARGLCMTHYQRFRRTYMGKGNRLSVGACVDGKPHPWGDGSCRICGVARPHGWS